MYLSKSRTKYLPIQNGFGLIKIVKLANDMLGFMITIFYFLLFTICCLGTFAATGLSHIYEKGTFYPALFFFILIASSLGIISAILLSFITRFEVYS